MRTTLALLVAMGTLIGPAAAAEPGTTGSEVITVHAPPVKPVAPQPLGDARRLPRYSDAAALGNYWSKAWLLLDIDATGVVRRVKFLHRPGHDLDPIAVETALALRFEPARDQHGRPTRTQMVWGIEWPSYWWLVHLTGFSERMPDPDGAAVQTVRCAGSGPLNLGYMEREQVYRDCSQPDLRHLASEAWIGS